MMGYLQGQDLANPTSKNYRDVQWAINACRYVMYAMEYVRVFLSPETPVAINTNPIMID